MTQDREAELLARAESLAFMLVRVAPDDCGNERACGEAADVIRLLLARADESRAFRGTTRFLIERLDEWSADNLTDDSARDWLGHVEPAIDRARAALNRDAE
jgi:hypothetical protein